MGVKSTTRLTREEAERRYVQFKLDEKREKYARKVKQFSDTDLENILEEMNDAKYEGGGFDNFLIGAAEDADA